MRAHDEHEGIDELAVDEIADAVEDEEEEQELLSLDEPSHATRIALAGEAPDEELDTMLPEDDVEQSLDVVLRRTTVGARTFEELEELEERGREAGEPSPAGVEHAVAPRTADEFLCPSCFLVKRRTQLIDAATMLCTDCADSTRAVPPHRRAAARGDGRASRGARV